MPPQQLDNDAAPAVKTGRAKPLMLIGSGVLLAGLLLVVVINIDSDSHNRQDNPEISEPIEVLPGPLTAEDEQASVFDPRSADQAPVLDEGGWIQTADPQTGKLAQQYGFVKLDPNPPGMSPGWARMVKPRAEIYLSQNRVLSLSGDSALAHLPQQVLESGTLTGHVTIRLFELRGDEVLDPQRDRPTLVVHTDEAHFDNFIGEVRCDGDFRIQTPSAEVPGRGLTLLINDRDERFELAMEQVDFIRLTTNRQPTRRTRASGGASDAGGPSEPVPLDAMEATAPAAITSRPRDSAEDEAPQFYRLTLHDEVRIRQGDEAHRRTMTGQMLTIVFSPQSEGLGSALTFHEPPSRHRPTHVQTVAPPLPRPLPDTLVASVLASYQQQGIDADRPPDDDIAPPPRDDDIYITCSGGLTMVPILDPAEHLASARDALLELSGRPVHLADTETKAEARCQRVVYDALAMRLELLGSSTYPLSILTPQLQADGQRFWLSQTDHAAGFTGPGSATRMREQADSFMSVPKAADSAPGAEGSVTAGSDRKEHPAQQLHIIWNDGVDLDFDEPTETNDLGNLSRATFRGGVEALSAAGTVSSDRLDVDLKTNEEGRTVPIAIAATGSVKAANLDQTVWGDRLHVNLREAESPTDHLPQLMESRDPIDPKVEVESFTAEGDVQIALPNGSRAFADKLASDAVTKTAQLTGSDVMIAYGDMLIDRGREIVLRQDTQTADWDGPGEARVFAGPIAMDADRRIDRPHLDEEPQMLASWQDSMKYDGASNNGAGALHLSGAIQATSKPNPLQLDSINAETATLQFVWTKDVETTERGDPTPAFERERRLGGVIAHGDVRLESRGWINEDHSDRPRVFYLAGEHVEYDDLTGEAQVPGAGELLIRDLRDTNDPGDSTPLGTKGTTAFRFKRGLRMTREADTLYSITMTDAVEMRHLSPDGQTATLVCDQLEATLDLPEGARRESGMTLGGPAQLRRLQAEGNVFFRTPTRDVECDEFTYDIETGIATLSAKPGRLVTVHSRGAPQSVRMLRAKWDLRSDTLTVIGGSGNARR